MGLRASGSSHHRTTGKGITEERFGQVDEWRWVLWIFPPCVSVAGGSYFTPFPRPPFTASEHRRHRIPTDLFGLPPILRGGGGEPGKALPSWFPEKPVVGHTSSGW